MSDKFVSVIIPMWNGREHIGDCLDAVLAQDRPNLEVIVVDDASTDSSVDLVTTEYPQVCLIRNRYNKGFAATCNVGIKAARGEILILLNQDTRVCAGWLESLIEAFGEFDIGIAGCKILYPDGERIQHAGGWVAWPLGLAYHYGKGEVDEGQWDEPREVEYVTGAAMAFRREVVDGIGLLDEEFWPGYFEDTDYCLRAKAAGYAVWYVPDAVLLHKETTSIGDGKEVSRFYHRGRLRFLLKHLPPRCFLEEFVPAERQHNLSVIESPEGDPLRVAYLEAIPTAAHLTRSRWRTDERMVEDVVSALQFLYRSPGVKSTSLIPELEEFKFRSEVPVIGPLIDRFRSLWFNAAAKWAVRYLSQQQEWINRQQEMHLRSLERRMRAENAFLAREIAHLILKTGSEEERKAAASSSSERPEVDDDREMA